MKQNRRTKIGNILILNTNFRTSLNFQNWLYLKSGSMKWEVLSGCSICLCVWSRNITLFFFLIVINYKTSSLQILSVCAEPEDRKTHLQQKVASATKLPIILIDKEGREINRSAVDVVTDTAAAPYSLAISGSARDAGTVYWRPWDWVNSCQWVVTTTHLKWLGLFSKSTVILFNSRYIVKYKLF